MIISVDPSTAEDIATFAMVKQYTLQTIQVTLEITGWTADAEHGGYVKTKSQGITGSLVTFTDPSAIVSYNITDGDTSNFDIASLAGIKLDSIVAGQTSYDFTFRADELPTDNTVIDVLVYGTQIVGGGSGGDPTSAEEITAAALQALDDRVTALEGAIEAEETARAEADTALGGRIDTEQARAEAAEQANAQAIANTYTKAEADTLLAGKASTTAVQTLDTRVGALETNTYTKAQVDTYLVAKADQATTYTKTETDTLLAGYVTLNTAQTIEGLKTFYSGGFTEVDIKSARTSGNIGGISFVNGSGITISQIYGVADGEIRFNLVGSTKAATIQNQRAYSAGNTSDIATISTLDAYTPMVRTTGNQEIGGDKVFSRGPAVKGTQDMSTTPASGFVQSGRFYFKDVNDLTVGWCTVIKEAGYQPYIQFVTVKDDSTLRYLNIGRDA